MHSSLTPAMDASLESKFSAAFEQQAALSQLMASGQKSTAAALAQLLTNGAFAPQSQQQQATLSVLSKNAHNLFQNSSTPPPQPISQAQPTSQMNSNNNSTTTTTEVVNGEKIISFRKEKDMDSFDEFSAFATDGLFTDLIICCAGRMFKCHRVVLASASMYIRDALSLFYNNNDDSNGPNGTCNHCNTVLILPGEIQSADVESILRFVYEGHVDVKTAGLETFIRSARTLAIKGLSNIKVMYNQDGSDGDLVSVHAEDDPTMERQLANSMAAASAAAGSQGQRRQNGFSKGQSMFSAANGINSPPPSPPNVLNSSLASLKALAQNQSLVSTLAAAVAHNGNNGANKPNGLSRPSLKGQSPRHQEQNTLLNNLPNAAHQSSTPKPPMFANGMPFFPSAASQIVPPSSGSRRKQKYPANIANAMQSAAGDMNPLAAFYSQLLTNAAAETNAGNEDDEKKFREEVNNDCSSATGELSFAEQVKQAAAQFGLQQAVGQQQNMFTPQSACKIEVEADPTNFPAFCDINEGIARLAAAANLSNGLVPTPKSNANKRKSAKQTQPNFVNDFGSAKKLKNAFGSGVSSSSSEMSMNPASPLLNLGLQNPPLDFGATKKAKGAVENKGMLSPFAGANKSPAAMTPGSNPAMSPNTGAVGSNWTGQKWKCDYCNKYYGNKQTLKEHMDYFHSNREEQIYICNICNKEYTWRKSLMKHYRDIHQMRNTPALTEINRQLATMSAKKPTSGGASSTPTQSGGGDLNSSAAAAAAAAMAAQSLAAGGLDAAQLQSLVAQLGPMAGFDKSDDSVHSAKPDDDEPEDCEDLSVHLEQSMQVCEDVPSDEETEVNQTNVNDSSGAVDLSSPLACQVEIQEEEEKGDYHQTPDSEASGTDSAIDATGDATSPGSARSSSASA